MRVPSVLRRQAATILAALALLAPLQGAAPNFLWKATGSNGGTVYLLGSIHLLTESYYPLAPEIEQAFKDSDLLVEEVDLDELLSPEMQLGVLMRSRLPQGQTLETVLKPETLALFREFTRDLGPSAAPLYRFKPWMLATVIEGLELEKAGFDPDLGLDKHFFDRSRQIGKPVKGLETADFQISLFDQMPMEQQEAFLAETLKQLVTQKANVTTLADAWRSGDAATIEKLALSDLKEDPVLYQRLLVDRNRAWLPQIEALLGRPGRAFIVVGAAHLVGPDGLLQMLRAKGITVEQM